VASRWLDSFEFPLVKRKSLFGVSKISGIAQAEHAGDWEMLFLMKILDIHPSPVIMLDVGRLATKIIMLLTA